jgi:hypothetical protein
VERDRRARAVQDVPPVDRGKDVENSELADRLRVAAIARWLGDPALLAFALNGVWMQTFYRCGLAAERDAIGAEVLALSARHGLVTFEIFGRLIRLQALGALGDFAGDTAWGPYEAWARPWLLIARNRPDQARNALGRIQAPPPGLLSEALWCLTARAAAVLDDRAQADRARDALLPAANEIAGAGSGMLTAGPVRDYLADVVG